MNEGQSNEREPSAAWRIATSPVGDLLQGRITGPLPRAPKALRGWRGVLAESALPAPLAALITDVLSRVRLWRSEKSDVARELIAHFADGLASGADAASLTESFGDPRSAARLITRSKKRTRPLWWRAMRRTRQAAGSALLATVVIYAYLAAIFWLRSPTIAHNYIAELNAAALAVPESDRAWPLYEQAILQQTNLPVSLWNGWGAYRPNDPEWPQVAAYVDGNRAVIDALHDASRRRIFGIPVSDQLTPALAEKIWSRRPQKEPYQPPPPPSENPIVISVLLPHLGESRSLGRLISADLFLAVERADPDRVVADIETLAGMGHQLAQEAFLISQLVGRAISQLALANVAEILRDSPQVLSDAHLARIAHTLARAGEEPVRFDVERLFLDDLLQRVYSDDGRGGGRLTPDGLKVLSQLIPDRSPKELELAYAATGPVQAVILANRRDVTREYDRLVGRMRESREKPMWQWGPRVSDAEFENYSTSRFALISVVIPAVERIMEGAEKSRQMRDATLTAIALELFRRRHSAYPASLAELTPNLLPSVPPDRLTGEPMRYTLRDGRPILFSVGLDRDDDGGRVPAAGPLVGFSWLPAEEVSKHLADPAKAPQYDGDVILWPPPPREPLVRPEEPPAPEPQPASTPG